METIADNLSFFKPPIMNTVPEKAISLHLASKIVMLGELEEVTKKVRSGAVKKTDKLPYITPSGCFNSRNDDGIISYSGIVCIDLDDLDKDRTDAIYRVSSFPTACSLQPTAFSNQHINSLKQMLFGDKFLKPAFIFTSPSGNGLKLFIRIKNADASFHNDYFNAISLYLFNQYNLTADPSCRDIARACLLCHDSEALFSPFGFVLSDDLLKYIPPRPPETPAFLSYFKKLYAHFDYHPDFRMHEANRLNTLSAVHERAERLLLSNGWTRTGIFFTRPGKAGGKSAEYCVPPGYQIFMFYNFTTNAPPFNPNKAYTDCQVIALLEFEGDYHKCIAALSAEYKNKLTLLPPATAAATSPSPAAASFPKAYSLQPTAYFKRRDLKSVLTEGVASKDRRKIVGAFLYEDTISLLFSRTNYGKSLLAFQFAYAAATGSQFDPCEALCNECEPMKTIVVDLELDHKTIADRHRLILNDPNPLISNFIYFHEQLENPLMIGFDLLQRIEAVAIEEEAKLLVIDNISKLLPDAVKPETATMVITILNQIRYKTGATILVIGHTTKGNPSLAIQPGDYYGSAMIQNFFNELFYLDKTKDGNFFIAHAKTKHKDNFDQVVPVLTRGEHHRLGFGFTFCYMQNIADIQLPIAFIPPKQTRKKPLPLCIREIQTLISAGFSQADIAAFCDVSRSAINQVLKT